MGKLAGGRLHTRLPRFGKRRRKGGKRKRAGVRLIPNRVGIEHLPEIVEKRERVGDWEGDTVYGQKASLVTLVEAARKAGYSQIEFPDRKSGIFGAVKVGQTAVNAVYQANFYVSKENHSITMSIQEFNALVPSTEEQLQEMIAVYRKEFEKQCKVKVSRGSE